MSPPATGSSRARSVPSPCFSMPVTLVESRNSMPCFCSMRWNCRATSLSMPGRMRSRNSTTVTLAPSRCQTEPSSSPMTPAPITSRCFGTCPSDSTPVEVTIFSSSISMPGRFAETEPVAMTMFLVSMVCVGPLPGVTSTLPGPTIEPTPRKAVILFLRNRYSTPLTLAATVSSLCAIMRGRLTVGGDARSMPKFEKLWPASS